MKITLKIAMIVGVVLLLARGLCASRYSMICPVHHVLAYATGQLRANGTVCEYRHSLGKGKMHTFWAVCDQLGLEERDPKESTRFATLDSEDSATTVD